MASVARLRIHDDEPTTREEQMAALVDAIARTIHYHVSVKHDTGQPFSELAQSRKNYLRKLAELAVAAADSREFDGAVAASGLPILAAVQAATRDVHDEWKEHSNADWLGQRLDEVEKFVQSRLLATSDQAFRAAATRLGIEVL